MDSIAIIGGTGLEQADFINPVQQHDIVTPYGKPSSDILEAKINSHKVFFLSRHGKNHTLAPHKINYRANIWALDSLKVKKIIAVAAVGGINKNMPPQALMLPDQIIDYTWGREHTFFDDDRVEHVEFGQPYCEKLRQAILSVCKSLNIKLNSNGTYGATQGPRLETNAEIRRMQQDGCDIVGMTAMPEAALARELGICYASIAICANWAAGISDKEISMDDISKNLKQAMDKVTCIIKNYFKNNTN